MPWSWPESAIFCAGIEFAAVSRPPQAWPWSASGSNSSPIAAECPGDSGWRDRRCTVFDRCDKVRPVARPSGDLACGRHSSLSNRADAFHSVFERRRTAMPKGTVKKIVSDRGFGFIAADDGKEYFFHQSGVDTSLNFDSLRGGETVSFDIEQSQKGPRANHVRAA